MCCRASRRKKEPPESQKARLNTFSAPESPIFHEHEKELEPELDNCWSCLVLLERHPLRVAWSCIIFVMLGYVATVYLYRFSFCSFHIDSSGPSPIGDEDPTWKAIDKVVDAIFWIDLFLCFFFSFRTERGVEVNSMRRVVLHYLTGYFWVNLVACVPELFAGLLVAILAGTSDSGQEDVDLRWARVGRLQRISRLTRLLRLSRILKCSSLLSGSAFMRWFVSLRGVRIVNFIFGLMFSVHLLACGWYLVAALHDDVHNTWVSRRTIDPSGTSLLDGTPQEQWVHAMYFVLTLFTTVGFGDIYAGTEFEIVYVAFTMLIGAVVHSIIISEVIRAVTCTDRLQEYMDSQFRLVQAFCEHSQLPRDAQDAMRDAIKFRAKQSATASKLDMENMKQLLTGKALPKWVLADATGQLFEGRLMKNQILQSTLAMPPRLPCLLAIHLRESEFASNEVVYQKHDFASNVFLVLSGTFAHVAMPSAKGGIDMNCAAVLEYAEASMTVSPLASARPRIKPMKSGRSIQSRSSSVSSVFLDRGKATFCDLDGRDKDNSGGLYPYMLFSHDTYFGDVELLTGSPRMTTVRCEYFATTLALHKQDFNDIKSLFPQFSAHWKHVACRREWARIHALLKLKRGLTFRQLAASKILEKWRARRGLEVFREVSFGPRTSSQSDIHPIINKHILHLETGQIMDKVGDCRGFLHLLQAGRLASFEKQLQKTREEVDGITGSVHTLRRDVRRILHVMQNWPRKPSCCSCCNCKAREFLAEDEAVSVIPEQPYHTRRPDFSEEKELWEAAQQADATNHISETRREL